MVGMLQIITYLLGFYLIVKGLEILQIGLSSNRDDRTGVIMFGAVVFVLCMVMAIIFVTMQDKMELSLQ